MAPKAGYHPTIHPAIWQRSINEDLGTGVSNLLDALRTNRQTRCATNKIIMQQGREFMNS